MSILRHVGHNGFSKHKVGEIKTTKEEFKWCFRDKVED
jgi:hypothetical protein